MPEWLEPMLAKLTGARELGTEYLYERKLDGQRILAFCERDEVRPAAERGSLCSRLLLGIDDARTA